MRASVADHATRTCGHRIRDCRSDGGRHGTGSRAGRKLAASDRPQAGTRLGIPADRVR